MRTKCSAGHRAGEARGERHSGRYTGIYLRVVEFDARFVTVIIAPRRVSAVSRVLFGLRGAAEGENAIYIYVCLLKQYCRR